MSLLADLLSKVKHKEQNGAIPPNLAQAVKRASGAKMVQTRIVVVLIVFAVLFATGFGTVYFINSYLRPSLPALVNKHVQPPNSTDAIQPQVMESVPAAKVGAPAALPAEASPQVSTKPVTKVTEPITGAANETKSDVTRSQKPKNTANQMDRKSAPSEKMKTASSTAEAAKSGKDVALYAAKTYEEERNYGQAIAHYKKALEKDPRNYLIMNKLASVLITTGSFKESTQYSANVLTIQKNYVPSLINLGIANIQLGNMTEGELYLSKAKFLEPSSKMVLFNLGLLYEKITKYDEALPLFQRLANMNDIQGNLGMARILEKQGKRAEAEKIYKDILWMDNADPATKQLANERIQANR